MNWRGHRLLRTALLISSTYLLVQSINPAQAKSCESTNINLEAYNELTCSSAILDTQKAIYKGLVDQAYERWGHLHVISNRTELDLLEKDLKSIATVSGWIYRCGHELAPNDPVGCFSGLQLKLLYKDPRRSEKYAYQVEAGLKKKDGQCKGHISYDHNYPVIVENGKIVQTLNEYRYSEQGNEYLDLIYDPNNHLFERINQVARKRIEVLDPPADSGEDHVRYLEKKISLGMGENGLQLGCISVPDHGIDHFKLGNLKSHCGIYFKPSHMGGEVDAYTGNGTVTYKLDDSDSRQIYSFLATKLEPIGKRQLNFGNEQTQLKCDYNFSAQIPKCEITILTENLTLFGRPRDYYVE